METIVIIIVIYLILLGDFKLSYINKKYVWKIEYNGLLWVGLDYWSIWKYNSDDKPMKWIHYEKSVI
jgi:hypothetical protein